MAHSYVQLLNAADPSVALIDQIIAEDFSYFQPGYTQEIINRRVTENVAFIEKILKNSEVVENTLEKDLVKYKKTNSTNVMMKNLDILVSLVYIFLLVVLLLGSVIKRDANNLINILIITLVYLFYQIYMSYKN